MSSSKIRETRFLTCLRKEKKDIHMICQIVIVNERAMDSRGRVTISWRYWRFTHPYCKCICALPTQSVCFPHILFSPEAVNVLRPRQHAGFLDGAEKLLLIGILSPKEKWQHVRDASNWKEGGWIPLTLSKTWETFVQVKKQQLEPDMEQWTGSTLGKECVKDVYCHPAYLTYMQSTSCEMPGWMKHELESRLLGEISITSDTQMTPPLW